MVHLRSSLAPFLIAARLFGYARASCYPTYPVATSVLVAGQPATIQWIEDNRQPLLRDMGPMDVQLLARNDTFVTYLTRAVDPLALKTTVFIPTKLPTGMKEFSLRFVPATSKVYPGGVAPIYSAKFRIIPNPFIPPKAKPIPPRLKPQAAPKPAEATAPVAHALFTPSSTFTTPTPSRSPPSLARITGTQSPSPVAASANQEPQTTVDGKLSAPGSALRNGADSLLVHSTTRLAKDPRGLRWQSFSFMWPVFVGLLMLF